MTIPPADKVSFKFKAPEAIITEYASQFDAKIIREEIRPDYPVPVKIIESRHAEGCHCSTQIRSTARSGEYEV